MPKTTQYHCDSCGEEMTDPTKNLLILSGAVVKFTKDGPKRVMLEQYFCSACSGKLLDFIEKMNEKDNPKV